MSSTRWVVVLASLYHVGVHEPLTAPSSAVAASMDAEALTARHGARYLIVPAPTTDQETR